MSVAPDIARARALFERAERETDPASKAHALDEALAVLASCDPDDIAAPERELISNLRIAHTRRLLLQLVGLASSSVDAWFDYAALLFGELKPEVERLVGSDPQLRANYDSFIELWGRDLGENLKRQTDAS